MYLDFIVSFKKLGQMFFHPKEFFIIFKSGLVSKYILLSKDNIICDDA